MSRWFVKKCSVTAKELVEFYGVGKPLAYALYHRKIRNKADIEKYVYMDNFPFEDIRNLSGVNNAFFIISEAIKNNKKIYIYGDYDADGVMSTAIMYKGLSNLDADVHYFIPDRIEDGYGLNEKALQRLIDEGAELIITCDNGISAINQIELAVKNGIKVVVLDHHEPAFKEIDGVKKDIIPIADAVVDAKIQNCGYSFTKMCAGGLCFRFICGFYDYIGKKLENESELCELAAVATVCDVVDLVGENRAITARGMALMNSGSNNLGLKTLIFLKGIKNITSYSVGFVIGPCINASGRLDSAKIAVELFTTDNAKRAFELAESLNEFNEERKAITAESFERISENIENSSILNDKVIVVYDEKTHESVAGIIAGRIRERYNRPAIVLTKAECGVKGSGRSVEKYDMFTALYNVKELLTKFGGHTMAAGLSMEEDNIALLRKRLNENCDIALSDMEPILRAETILDLRDICFESVEELNILAPFGKANEKPLFGLKNIMATNIRFVGAKSNIVSFIITDGNKRVRAVDFDNCECWLNWLNANHYSSENYSQAIINIDGIFSLEINEYKEYKNPQIVMKDIKIY